MDSSGQMLRSLQPALDKSLIYDHLGGNIGEFTPLPSLDAKDRAGMPTVEEDFNRRDAEYIQMGEFGFLV